MPPFHDRPARPEARTCPSHKDRWASAEVQRSLVAMRRFEVAKAAAEAGPRPSDMVKAVRAIQDKLADWVPTRPTICALAEIWVTGPEEARVDPSYYLIQHAGGRPKARLADALQLLLDADLEETPRLETGKLITRLEAYATRCGFDLPGERALRRIIEDARGGVLGRSAGGHGRRAAEVDGVPHETLPYERPHECWTEDEFVLPLWVGMWHATKSQWISTMIYVALVLDYVSRAILAWHLCDPRRRRGSAREPVFTGFDEQDIATVFLKAARPELAPDLLVPFTGFLPEHIRMDAHATHHQWRMSVKGHIPTAIHILSAYRPYRNGIHERCGFTVKEEFDAFFAGPPGTGKSHLAQALGQAAIQQGHRVLYREAHLLLEELTDATLDGTRKEVFTELSTVPLLIIDDLGMRKLPPTAAEDLLELIMRRYERASTILTSNRPVDDWGKLLGDTAAVTALLDRLLHHAHVIT
ncbi:MAG: ATP-binding protein, partial [Gemmatimonas sp.]